MDTKQYLREYNHYEDELIGEFNRTPFYQKTLPFMSKEEFTEYLLQLGHLSFEFVKFLERAKLGLHTETGKEAVRAILRDEIPLQGPTHQDNRISDLLRIGFNLEDILNTPQTQETQKTIRDYYRNIHYPQDFYNIRALVFVRVVGEVLVGETYRHVVAHLTKHFRLPPAESLFYTFHWKHDTKGGVGDHGGGGHTEYYDAVLKELIIDEETLAIAKSAARSALEVRNAFHAQFLGKSSAKATGTEQKGILLNGAL